ncbi:MAG: T9SS type A sorting domain-containing protein [Bacteroidetes bacterium]|nr:T9SS type A sorting domain-containing protein [Bacteroidota bacterium]
MKIEFQIYDLKGKLVMSISSQTGDPIDVGMLAPGIYTFRINNAIINETHKIAILR